jgi:GT2 family glycosyltransferase
VIYIVIPVFNRISKTVSCLESIFKQSYPKIKVIVVDSGSTDDTRVVLERQFPSVVVLKSNDSIFWTGAVRLGIEYVLKNCNEEDWILLINNDVQVENDTIDRLVSFSRDRDRRVIVNAVSVDFKDRDTIVKSGTIVKSWFLNRTHHVLHGNSLFELGQKNEIEVDLLTGRCLLHPVEIFNKIGNYNSYLFPHYGGDDEFTARAKRFGYNLYVLPSAVIYLDNDKSNIMNSSILKSLFGIRSSINIINKWRFAKASVPLYALPTYYLIAIMKTLFIMMRNK